MPPNSTPPFPPTYLPVLPPRRKEGGGGRTSHYLTWREATTTLLSLHLPAIQIPAPPRWAWGPNTTAPLGLLPHLPWEGLLHTCFPSWRMGLGLPSSYPRRTPFAGVGETSLLTPHLIYPTSQTCLPAHLHWENTCIPT